jgi:hypothetical protein
MGLDVSVIYLGAMKPTQEKSHPPASVVRTLTPLALLLLGCGGFGLLAGCATDRESHMVSAPPPPRADQCPHYHDHVGHHDQIRAGPRSCRRRPDLRCHPFTHHDHGHHDRASCSAAGGGGDCPTFLRSRMAPGLLDVAEQPLRMDGRTLGTAPGLWCRLGRPPLGETGQCLQVL